MIKISRKKVEQIQRINECYLLPIYQWLMWVNTFVGIVVAVAHVYIAVHTLPGLIMGVILALCGALTMQLQARFTQNNIADEPDKFDKNTLKKVIVEVDTPKTNLFICLFCTAIILTSASLFFSLYTSVPLLTEALQLSWSPMTTMLVACSTSLSLAVGSLIGLWMQTFNSWQRLREEAGKELSNQAQVSSHNTMNSRLCRLAKRRLAKRRSVDRKNDGSFEVDPERVPPFAQESSVLFAVSLVQVTPTQCEQTEHQTNFNPTPLHRRGNDG